MLRFEFTNQQLEEIKSKIHFTPMQERIIDYRRDEMTIIEMAIKEVCSESKISKEIKKIEKKMDKLV